MKKLHELVSLVKTKDDLVEFVRALKANLHAEPDSWENPTLEAYLSALARWVEDSEGYYRNHGRPVPQEPTWRDLAEMLIAAKMYE